MLENNLHLPHDTKIIPEGAITISQIEAREEGGMNGWKEGRKEGKKEGWMEGRKERTNERTNEGRNERREGGREGGKNDKINIFGLICLLWLICLSSCGPRKYNCCSLIDFCAFQWVVMPATFSKLMQLPETFFYIILVILIKDDYRSL